MRAISQKAFLVSLTLTPLARTWESPQLERPWRLHLGEGSFPFTLLSTTALSSITLPFLVVQYPVYGFVVSVAGVKGRLVSGLLLV